MWERMRLVRPSLWEFFCPRFFQLSPSIPYTKTLFHVELLSQTSLEEKLDFLFRKNVIWKERTRPLLKP